MDLQDLSLPLEAEFIFLNDFRRSVWAPSCHCASWPSGGLKALPVFTQERLRPSRPAVLLGHSVVSESLQPHGL